MIAEAKVIERIIELEINFNDPENEWEGVEGEVAELSTLYWVLDRGLTTQEKRRISEGQAELME